MMVTMINRCKKIACERNKTATERRRNYATKKLNQTGNVGYDCQYEISHRASLDDGNL